MKTGKNTVFLGGVMLSDFPIHPAYLEKFELISIAEKREILKTLSAEMRRRLDDDVPTDESGLVS